MSTKIGFIDTFDPVPAFFMDMLDGLDVVRDDIDPDVLIFGDENFGTRNRDPKYAKCFKVFYTGENRRPWHYDCDAAITFDHIGFFRNSLTPDAVVKYHFRLPLWILNLWHYHRMGLYTVQNDELIYTYPWKKQEHFASFVVANPNCPERNEFFHTLNRYKKVSSAGPLFNNVGFVLPRGETGVKDKIDFLSSCKFNICFENSSYPGYVSEKLLDAHLAGTIPIYWGSSNVDMDFNPKAFINVMNFPSFEDVVEYVRKVDNDPELYMDMVSEQLLYDCNVVSNVKKPLQEWFEREVLCHIGEHRKTI